MMSEIVVEDDDSHEAIASFLGSSPNTVTVALILVAVLEWGEIEIGF